MALTKHPSGLLVLTGSLSPSVIFACLRFSLDYCVSLRTVRLTVEASKLGSTTKLTGGKLAATELTFDGITQVCMKLIEKFSKGLMFERKGLLRPVRNLKEALSENETGYHFRPSDISLPGQPFNTFSFPNIDSKEALGAASKTIATTKYIPRETSSLFRSMSNHRIFCRALGHRWHKIFNNAYQFFTS